MFNIRTLQPYMRDLVFRTDALSGIGAISLMRLHGVSSVALINGGGRRPIGTVHRKDLYEYYFDQGRLPERASEVKREATTAALDTPLGEVIASWNTRSKFILVKSDDGVYRHIITNRVLADFWIDYAAPFSHLDQTETLLREIVGSLGPEALQQACNATSVEQLNPRDYERLFAAYWSQLPCAHLDRETILAALTHFAEFRNRVMHFRLRSEDEDASSEIPLQLQRLEGLQATLQAVAARKKG